MKNINEKLSEQLKSFLRNQVIATTEQHRVNLHRTPNLINFETPILSILASSNERNLRRVHVIQNNRIYNHIIAKSFSLTGRATLDTLNLLRVSYENTDKLTNDRLKKITNLLKYNPAPRLTIVAKALSPVSIKYYTTPVLKLYNPKLNRIKHYVNLYGNVDTKTKYNIDVTGLDVTHVDYINYDSKIYIDYLTARGR